MFNRSLTVRASVMLFVAIATAGAVLLGMLAQQQIRHSQSLSDQLLADVQLVRAAVLVDMVHDGLLATTRGALLTGPGAPADVQAEVRAELTGMRQTLDEAQRQMVANATDGAVQLAAEDLRPALRGYVDAAQALVGAALSGQPEVPVLRQRFEADFKALETRLDQFGRLIEANAASRLTQRDALFERQRLLSGGVAVAMVALLLVLGHGFARGLLHRLGAEPDHLRQFAQRIADGSLATRFHQPVRGQDSVAAALEGMRDRLCTTVASIREGADSVASGSAQIASGNQDLAERTSRQACSLQAAAIGMADVTGSVQQTATHAQAADALAAETSVAAQRGGEVVHRVVATMAEIEAASRRIADITTVIAITSRPRRSERPKAAPMHGCGAAAGGSHRAAGTAACYMGSCAASIRITQHRSSGLAAHLRHRAGAAAAEHRADCKSDGSGAELDAGGHARPRLHPGRLPRPLRAPRGEPRG